MSQVERNTQQDPSSEDARASRCISVQTKHPHHREKHAIHHRRAGTKVVQLFRNRKISRVKDTTEDPTRETKGSEAQVIFPQRIAGWYLLSQYFHAMVMSQEVEQREDDGEGLLHAEETVKGPFAMKLKDGLTIGRFAGEAFVGDDVLAGIVAFGGTVPQEEAVLERCR